MNSKTSDQTLEGGTRDGGADGGSLGEQLRRAREARGVSLRAISEQTRITMRHLEAIESDDYKHLPGGIFNRSFVKAYARYIKFDENAALDLYARTSRERGEEDEEPLTTPQRSRIYTDGDTARSPLVTFLLSALIIGILILVVYAGLHYYRRTEAPAPDTGAAAQPPASAANGPTTNPATAAQTTTQSTAAPDQLNVIVKARNDVWVRVLVDDEAAKGKPGVVWQAGRSQEYAPQQKLTLNYAKTLGSALEVTVNGTRLKVPADTRPGVSQEWVISKDDYKQYAQ